MSSIPPLRISTRTTPKVAILQNQFRLSGRTKVVCEVIGLLNEMGIVPDILTLTPIEVGRSVGSFFGLDNLQFEYIQVAKMPFIRGWLWQILLINRLTRSHQGRYDLVFNSNNTLHGLNLKGRYLHYIHYPVALSSSELQKFQEFTQTPIRYLYGWLLGELLARSGKVSVDQNIYTNSEFSRDAIVRTYPESAGQVGIIYPPSFSGNVKSSSTRSLQCVSTGSIAPDKRQMEQLAIASRLPEIQFWIVGAAKSFAYYRACQRYIEREGVTNVRLVADMPYWQLQDLLNSSMFFLHTKRDEHFGIGTVEAIAAGCIPITHNSGGQREVVPIESLRFDILDQAVEIFQRLLQAETATIEELRLALQGHITKFSSMAFRDDMRQVLNRALFEGV